ncbi:alpha/beta fold hydrolase [Candidatus Bipolaricaulota bacterium]|nr:alpha/beta fold hydrolase [Candidatus Bipolaricaulota bacterium]
MPKKTINGVDLYYEVKGEGPPLVMIQGLGYSSRFWFNQVPELKEDFELVLFDNRDVGKSEIVDREYEMEDMARDVKGLIDELNLNQVNVLGLSMGGYIAQHLALGWPDLVEKLILVSTHAGGPKYLAATGDLWEEILDVEGLSEREIYRKGYRYSVSEDFFEDEETVEKLVDMRVEDAQPEEAYQRQFQAASEFDLSDRLGEIETDTLIVSGEEDRVVPGQFAEQLNEGIPNSRLEVVEGAAHLIHIEKPEVLNSLVTDFISDSNG